MTTGDPAKLPTSIGGLVERAVTLYARRAALYVSLAVAAFAVQYVAVIALQPWFGVLFAHAPIVHRNDALMAAVSVIVDAFVAAAVSIGVAHDAAGTPAGWQNVLRGASERWGVVAIVGFVSFMVMYATGGDVFGPPADTAFGLLIVPILMFWGALAMATVVASIEPVKSRLMLPLTALGKGFALAFRLVNLGRLAVFAAMLAAPILLSVILGDQFRVHHVRDGAFWANVPVDAFFVGPLQALTTAFYLDFVRRAAR